MPTLTVCLIGVPNFSKSIGGGGGQRVKSGQGKYHQNTAEIGFPSELTHFLAIIGGPGSSKTIYPKLLFHV